MGNRDNIEEGYKKIPLAYFPFYLFTLEKKIYDLTKLGETTTNSNRMKKLKYKRNVARCVLLEKLKYWSKNPGCEPDLTYEQIIQRENLKKGRG